MNELTSLQRRSPEIQCPPIGMDVTKMLAASSYIETFDGKSDPRAGEEFETTASAFCNGYHLWLPLPKSSSGEDTLFLRLWKRCGEFTSVPGVELSDQAFDGAVAGGRATEFEKYADRDALKVSRWIAFQFTQAIAEGHLRRADHLVTERCEPLVSKMIEEKKFPELHKKLNNLLSKGELDCPTVYRDSLEAFPSVAHLCIAYAMSVALRGISYSLALNSNQNPRLYRSHWMRKPVVNTIENNGVEFKKETLTIWEFPWGAILKGVFDPGKSETSWEPEAVESVLIGIREQSSDVRKVVQQGLFDTSANSREALNQVHKWLSKAGCKLRENRGYSTSINAVVDRSGQELMESGFEMASKSPELQPFGGGLAFLGGVIRFRKTIEELWTATSTTFMDCFGSKTHIRIYRDVDPAIRGAIRKFRASRPDN